MKNNIWQAISAVIAIVSLFWGVYQFSSKKTQKQTDAVEIIRLAEELVQSRQAIEFHRDQFNRAQSIIDSVLPLMGASQAREDSLVLLSRHYLEIVENLKKQINEKPALIHASDSFHLTMFLSWKNKYQFTGPP